MRSSGAIGGLRQPRPYFGPIGSRGVPADTTLNPYRRAMSRCVEFLRDDPDYFQICDSNFYLTQTAESWADLGPFTLRRALLTSTGWYRVTWGGADFVVIQPGTAMKFSYPIPNMWRGGGPVWMDAFLNNGNNGSFRSPMCNHFYPAGGEMTSFSASQADLTGQAWTGDASQQQIYRHTGIFGWTRKATAGLICDSKGDPNAEQRRFWWAGELARIPQVMGTLHLSRASQTLANFLASSEMRRQFLPYVSHAVLGMGTNDLAAGATAAEMLARRQAVRALQPDKSWWETTLYPRVSLASGGAYNTLAGQSPVASEPHRLAGNDTILGGTAGFEGVFDINAAVESSRRSGKFLILPGGAGEAGVGITSDGVHLNEVGVPLCARAVDPYRLQRVA